MPSRMTVRATGATRSARHAARRANVRSVDAGGRIAPYRRAIRAGDRVAREARRAGPGRRSTQFRDFVANALH
jgi:hypothetical protein